LPVTAFLFCCPPESVRMPRGRTTMLARVISAALLGGSAWAAPCEDQAACDAASDDLELLQITSPGSKSVGQWAPGTPLARRFPAGAGMLQETVGAYGSCRLDSSDCSLEGMGGKPTLVYPGGDTRCINGDEYAFAVVPGDADKLLYYFEGGGACWQADGAVGHQVVQQCTNSLAAGIATTGFGLGMQADSEGNPLSGYTIVEPIYCSGDAFMGDTTMSSGNVTLIQKGYANGLAVMEWAKKNFPGELASFVVMGFSAGSLGTMAWSTTLLSEFKYKKAAVILDSYAGIFPDGTQGPTITGWGGCRTRLMPFNLKIKCLSHAVTVQDKLKEAMKLNPNVTFASIQSKVDHAQLWFYQGMAQSWGMLTDMMITGPQFYAKANALFRDLLEDFPNYRLYLVDGDQHCFTSEPYFSTASTAGKESPAPEDVPTLQEWVGRVLSEGFAGVSAVECEGPEAPNGDSSSTYCDEALLQ